MSSSGSTFAISRGQRIATHAVLIALCIPFVLPLVWMITTSLKTSDQIRYVEGKYDGSRFHPDNL